MPRTRNRNDTLSLITARKDAEDKRREALDEIAALHASVSAYDELISNLDAIVALRQRPPINADCGSTLNVNRPASGAWLDFCESFLLSNPSATVEELIRSAPAEVLRPWSNDGDESLRFRARRALRRDPRFAVERTSGLVRRVFANQFVPIDLADMTEFPSAITAPPTWSGSGALSLILTRATSGAKFFGFCPVVRQWERAFAFDDVVERVKSDNDVWVQSPRGYFESVATVAVGGVGGVGQVLASYRPGLWTMTLREIVSAGMRKLVTD